MAERWGNLWGDSLLLYICKSSRTVTNCNVTAEGSSEERVKRGGGEKKKRRRKINQN